MVDFPLPPLPAKTVTSRPCFGPFSASAAAAACAEPVICRDTSSERAHAARIASASRASTTSRTPARIASASSVTST